MSYKYPNYLFIKIERIEASINLFKSIIPKEQDYFSDYF